MLDKMLGPPKRDYGRIFPKRVHHGRRRVRHASGSGCVAKLARLSWGPDYDPTAHAQLLKAKIYIQNLTLFQGGGLILSTFFIDKFH